jgi:hypothetical protein
VADSGLPWTTLRAAQFHELVLTVVQKIAKRPKGYGAADLIRGYLQARGKRRLMMPVRIPGMATRTYRTGENLSPQGAAVGKRTWEDFLAERLR